MSPEKQCGKTRLLDVLELVVARPWRAIMPSEAVLFRKIDAVTPTLLLDEADAIFDKSNGTTEPLRALLNAGNRRGTSVPRCVGPRQSSSTSSLLREGARRDRRLHARHRSRPLDPDPPGAQAPRRGRRRLRHREALETAEPLQQELASWAQDAVADLESARPDDSRRARRPRRGGVGAAARDRDARRRRLAGARAARRRWSCR